MFFTATIGITFGMPEEYSCAEWALDVCEYFGADVSEENGLRFYQEANRWCESK